MKESGRELSADTRLYICEETGQPFFKKKLSNYGY